MDLGQGHAAGSRAVDRQHHFISSRRRRIARSKGRGDEAIGSAYIGRAKSEADGIGRTASEHACAVECISTDALESSWTRKHVHLRNRRFAGPAVVPQSKLGIIAEEGRVGRVHLQRVEKPAAANGVVGLGHSDALEE